MPRTAIVRTTLLALASALFFLCAQAIAGAPTKVDVPAGELATALDTLAKQAGVEFIYSAEKLRGIHTNGVRGEYTAEEAVTKLLEGTNLHVTVHASGALLISDANAAGNGAATAEPESARASGNAQMASKQGASGSSRPPQANEERSREATADKAQSPAKTQDAATGNPIELETLIVTGTYIPGATPTSPLIRLDRNDIDRSGKTTVQDVLADLPQNYAGVNAASSFVSGGNTGLTSEIDLRGLGSEATLTLVNGRRIASGAGDQARAVDISMLPLAAVDHIEILTDGASALYGSDAIGGVVNIVLRRDFEGAQTSVQRGWNQAGADNWLASQLIGTNWTGGHLLAAVQYQQQDALKSSEVGIHSTDFRSMGGGDFREAPFGAPGTALPIGYFAGEPFSTLTTPAGDPVYAAALPPGNGRNVQLSELGLNQTNSADLLTEELSPEQRSLSTYLTFEQEVGAVTIFADAAYSKRKAEHATTDVINYVVVPETNAFTPFSEPVIVAYDFKEFGPTTFHINNEGWFADAGVRGDLPFKNWNWELIGISSRDQSERLFSTIDMTALAPSVASNDPAVAFNPFGDGSGQPAGFHMPTIESGFRAVTQLESVALNARGELAQLPAGALRVATGAEYRDEKLDGRGVATDTGTVLFDNSSRNATAVYGEIYVPITGTDFHSDFGKLALSVAGRYERYSDFGETTNPKVGFVWEPTPSVTLKANWGTSFRAPLLRELSQASTTLPNIPVFDPNAPGGPALAFPTLVIGGNTDLKPETADTYTVSGEYRPDWIRGASFSASYFNIDYKERIRGALDGLSVGTLLQFESALPPGIAVRDADGKLTLLKLTNINSATTRMSGVDLAAGYNWSTAQAGEFSVRAAGTVMLNYEDQLIAGAPTLDLNGVVGNPSKWRALFDFTWTRGPWSASAIVHHTDGLYNTDPDTRIVRRDVDSQTTLDAQVSLKLPQEPGWAQGWSVQLGALNLFDERSPFVDGANNFGVDSRNFYIQGRTVYVRFSKAFGAAAP